MALGSYQFVFVPKFLTRLKIKILTTDIIQLYSIISITKYGFYIKNIDLFFYYDKINKFTKIVLE